MTGPSGDGSGLRARHAELSEQVTALQLSARRLSAGVLSGLHRSMFRGGSAEFAEYKEYSPGDDPRTIDWKSVARSDRWFVKRYEETTNRRCWLVLDASASMAFARGGRPSKLDVARLSLAGLATLLLGQGDAVGAAMLQDGSSAALVPPHSRHSHLEAVLTRLVDVTPRGPLDLGAALDGLAPALGRRSLLVLASDLVDDLDSFGASVRRLAARGHEIVLLHVLDPDEIEFPFQGMLRFRDPETGQEVIADAQAVRDSYRDQVSGFLAACDGAAAGAQADLVRLTTGDDPAQPLLRFLARRRALARRVMRAG